MRRMTPDLFNEFTEAKQRRMLMAYGAYLSHRVIDHCTAALLYQHEDFYVEVQFNCHKLNILLVVAFDASSDMLDPYLESISINLLTA